MIVTPSNVHHGLPVVLVDAKNESEDGDQNDRGQQSGNISRQHGVVGPRASDTQVAALLLCRDKPGNQGAYKTENG